LRRNRNLIGLDRPDFLVMISLPQSLVTSCLPGN
jgi:hypothetical protein